MGMADFKHGDPIMVEHVPGSAIAVGDVVVTADTARIAHLAIPAGSLGALAAGGGVYEVVGNGLIAADRKVWWVAADSKITLTASTHRVFGVTVTACGGDGQTCLVRHDPSA